MSSYKGPSIRDLLALAEEMKKTYKGVNPSRLSFIALYDQLVKQVPNTTDFPEHIMNVLVGALVYEMADIKFREYKGASPKVSAGWIYSTGSELYTLIKSRLNITKKNKFKYDERLFYINEFYKYVEKVYPEEAVQEIRRHKKVTDAKQTLIWRDKTELQAHVHEALKLVLKQNADTLHNIVHGVPVLNALLKNMERLEDEYLATSSNPTNPKRLESLHFINFIIQSYQVLNPEAVTANNTVHPFIAASWHVIAGGSIAALMRIEKEYKVLSPTRSKLFAASLKALRQENFNAITLKDKIECLRALAAHVTTVRDNPEYYKVVVDAVIENANTKGKKLDFVQVNKEIINIQNKLETYLQELTELQQQPSNTSYAVSTATSYTVQYAVGPIALQAAKNIIFSSLGLGTLFAVGSNPVGLALFGATGILMSGVGRLVSNGVLNGVTGNLAAWLLEKIGDSIGNATAAVAAYPFSPTPTGFAEMRNKLKHEDDLVYVNMVNTMLEIDLISDKDKEAIRNVFGIDKDCFMQPIRPRNVLSDEDQKDQDELLREGFICRNLNSEVRAAPVCG